MIVHKEIRKKGQKDFKVADVSISQKGTTTLEISAGPVFWKGEDLSLSEPTEYDVVLDAEEKWIDVFLVKRTTDGACVVFIDEGYSCEPRYDFAEYADYLCMYKIGGIAVPEGETTLDNARVVLRRWVVNEEEG